MNLKLETEFSKAPILQEVDALKKQIDDMRPLPEDLEGRVMQKLRLDWNYHSNAIEGNKLNYGETVAFLMEGITAKGKPLKDHLDIRGHNEAINFLLSIVKDARPISESEIRSLHKMILVEPYEVDAQTTDGLATKKRINLGEYKTSANHVKTATGEMHYYATPEETPAKMQELMGWYSEANDNEDIHPIVAAALFHHKFVSIHPFDDGNGRLSRILMNLILMQKGYPPVVIKMDHRINYYSLLSRADNGDGWPFVVYISEEVKNSLELYVKAAKGEDINDEDDIDKEIALFKMELLTNIDVKDVRSLSIINNILALDVIPLINKLAKKIYQFEELFFNIDQYVSFNTSSRGTTDFESIEEFYNSEKFEVSSQMIEDLEYLQIVFECEKFKNSYNDFNIKVWCTVEFSENYYKVKSDNDTLVATKLYHERLHSSEQNLIVKSLITDLKNNIYKKLNQKSPESN
ncbi:Fic family protein [Mucilaginibacter psychrotolerans]|uniref:Fic family protein n=1 Tax=Mucilaginibacter psychrotolerans TaxID=1524096 RepID=A0A4Y8S4R1_9SPHI|nr:Fic family protein [Mucilaginibacter psychrotolerans]TFF33625.1 Fic family protein [Mucilaginibacter psychrotolerans]